MPEESEFLYVSFSFSSLSTTSHSESICKLKNDKDAICYFQSTLTKAINQVQKARKALSNSNGKYPDDSEIAKFTGLSIAKIMSASKCLRVVGSIDRKIGDKINMKYMVRLKFKPLVLLTLLVNFFDSLLLVIV